MTRSTLRLTVASLLLSPALALAAVPGTIAFSARVADNGRPVTGTQAFVFKLWNDPTASDAAVNLVWTEPATGTKDLAVTDGVVTTALGDTVALPAFTGAPLYLEVTMGGTTFPQRVALQTVPYAFRAAVADAATSAATAASADTAAAVPWTGITGRPTFRCTWSWSAAGTAAAAAATSLDTPACPAGSAATGSMSYVSSNLPVFAIRTVPVLTGSNVTGFTITYYNSSATASSIFSGVICCTL